MNQIKKGINKAKEQKRAFCNTEMLQKQETVLLIFLMVILQCYLKQNTKQFMEKESKY